MSADNEFLREYEAGDEINIVKMHQEVFRSKKNLRQWRWQFSEHVQGPGWITLAEIKDEIVGHYCMMRNDLNFMGRRVVAAQSCDTMVRSNQRGKKLFTKLAIANYEDASKKGVQAVFGFPNRNSYPGLMKYLEWRRIMNLKRYSYRIGYKRIWGPIIDHVFKYFLGVLNRLRYLARLKFVDDNLHIIVSPCLPDDLEDCLQDVRDYEVLSLWKDLSYLRWRYENHPNCRYSFHILYSQGKLEGIIVGRKRGETIAICELLHRARDMSKTALLLFHFVQYYHASDAQIVEFNGYDNGFFDAVFSACCFKSIPSPNFIFGGRFFQNNNKMESMFANSQNWTISYGDTDFI